MRDAVAPVRPGHRHRGAKIGHTHELLDFVLVFDVGRRESAAQDHAGCVVCRGIEPAHVHFELRALHAEVELVRRQVLRHALQSLRRYANDVRASAIELAPGVKYEIARTGERERAFDCGVQRDESRRHGGVEIIRRHIRGESHLNVTSPGDHSRGVRPDQWVPCELQCLLACGVVPLLTACSQHQDHRQKQAAHHRPPTHRRSPSLLTRSKNFERRRRVYARRARTEPGGKLKSQQITALPAFARIHHYLP